MRLWSAPSLEFKGRRSPVLGTHGMVASSQPLASEAGLRILKCGGYAVDAAIAVAAVLNVAEPCSTGLGGDCFMLYYEAKTKQVYGLNGSGRSPAALTLERAAADCGVAGTDEMEPFHAHTVTVPGAAAGWCDSVERYGSKKLSMADLLAPAITMAEEGFPVSPVTAYWWHQGEDQLNRPGNNQDELLLPSGKTPGAGEVFRNPTLAQTMRELAQGGKDAFYQGRVGKEIVELVQAHGGLLSMEDIAAHESTWVEPISSTYGPLRVWEIPPNGQGLTALLGLNIIKALSKHLEAVEHNSADYLHLLIEALRLAFADTRWFVADPAKVSVPIDELLSEAYAAARAEGFDPTKAQADVQRGRPTRGSCTVSFQVVDQEGNAVSFVNSNYMGFGTGLVPKGCGFTLQNRGHNFSLDPKCPNALEPGKRPYHTIIPGLATYASSNELFATFSNMGGFMQPAGHVQLLLNMLQFGLDPQRAVDAPRFCITDGTADGAVSLEAGIPDSVVMELKRRGHHILDESRRSGFQHHAWFGRAQIIACDPATGVLWAGSDGRADGCAMGW